MSTNLQTNARNGALLALLLLVALFLGVNFAAGALLRGARVDLTQNRLYTLSTGTRNILRSLDEPIRLTLFYSESAARGRPALQAYGRRVIELLEEYRLRSRGRVTFEVLDPVPFSEAEDRARREGVTGVPLDARTEFFLGLVGTNSTDGREVIRFLDPGQERLLEYDITRLVHMLSNPERRTVGLMTSLPLEGRPAAPGMPPEMTRPWRILGELREQFEIETVATDASAIPETVDLLLLLHAKQLGDPTLRAIDAFIRSGKTAIVVIDPLCEVDIPPDAAQNPAALMAADRTSNLDALLVPWGVTLEPGKVVTDLDNAMRGRAPEGREVVPFLQYLALRGDSLSDDDPVTGGLSMLQMATVGALTHDASQGTAWSALVRSSARASLADASRFAMFADPRQALTEFIQTNTRYTLAGRLSGKVKSPFDSAAPEAEVNLIVVADADMFYDRWWIDEVRIGNSLLGYEKTSDNGDFLVNAIDNLTGSNDLISVRARGGFSRPFTMVERIQRSAEQKYLSEADALEERRRETEQRLAELRRARPDDGKMILTPEQQAEIDGFREQLTATNAQLRQVRFNLNRDVEKLGHTLRIVNIVLAPAMVALGALALSIFRSGRRRADRRSMAGEG